ncbi:hypothetical protein ACTHQ0_29365 [Priestia megaterium]|jgi:hypothetical protein|uniref:hypothetical protein n=1 Tax=Priestia megaterium TaxID=1404 RepID=UPI003F7D0776
MNKADEIKMIVDHMNCESDINGLVYLVTENSKYKAIDEQHGTKTAIEEIMQEYPKLFDKKIVLPSYKDENSEHGGTKKRVRYNPGKQKHNMKARPEMSGRERGRKRAQDRHRPKSIKTL